MLKTTIYFIWIVFSLSWLVAAFTARKPLISRSKKGISLRLILFAILIFALKYHSQNTMNTKHDLVLKVIGTIFFVLGLALAIWARVYLGRNWGTPMAVKAEPELVTNGPHKFVRHPIYSGILLANLGTALAISYYWLIVMVVMGSYFIYSAFMEEKTMTRQFPSAYPKYMKSSKMLIPFVF